MEGVVGCRRYAANGKTAAKQSRRVAFAIVTALFTLIKTVGNP